MVHDWLHTIKLRADDIVIISGGMIGAFYKTQVHQLFRDILTLHNVESCIIVATRVFIGAIVSWGVKMMCNYLKRKFILKKRSNDPPNN